MPVKRPFEEAQYVPHIKATRPLLPKKGWEPLTKPLPARVKHITLNVNTCAVPECKVKNCNLRTHQQYARKSKALSQSSSSTSAASSVSSGQDGDLVYRNGHSPSPSRIGAGEPIPRNDLHGLEGLPDMVADKPVFRSLFQEFCGRVYDRLRILLNPPPIDLGRKKALVALATTSQAFCLNAIACVSNDIMMRRQDSYGDRTAAVLYGKTMGVLRAQVANFETAEVDNLLMIIMTLALFDIIHFNFSSLDVHRQGMDQLVSKVGGVHNLKASLSIVLHLDRVFAIFTGAIPLYALPIDRNIRRPSKYREVYGSYFESVEGRACIDQPVCDFSSDVSRVFDLFEGAKISFDPRIANMPVASADVLYFYFSRERVAIEFTHLHHRYWGKPCRSRCVLLATKILDYTILLDNYINVIPAFLAIKLKENMDILRRNPNIWREHEDLLMWLLFVLVMMADSYVHDDWPFVCLRIMLANKYNTFLSRNWRQEELQNMKRFVWCSSRLDEIFLKTCDELASSLGVTEGGLAQRKALNSMVKRKTISGGQWRS